MKSIPAKNRAVLFCAAWWLFSFIAGDLLHSATHDLFEAKSGPHSCLICQFTHQPSHADPGANASLLSAPEYSETVAAPLTGEIPRPQTCPQPLIPRGPPA